MTKRLRCGLYCRRPESRVMIAGWTSGIVNAFLELDVDSYFWLNVDLLDDQPREEAVALAVRENNQYQCRFYFVSLHSRGPRMECLLGRFFFRDLPLPRWFDELLADIARRQFEGKPGQEPVDPETVKSHLTDQGWLAEFIANHLGSRIAPILLAYDYYDEESNPASHRESAEHHPLKGFLLYRVSFKPARAGSPFPSWSENVDVYAMADGSIVQIKTCRSHFTNSGGNYTTDVSETVKTEVTPLTEAEIEGAKDKIAGAMLVKVRRRLG